MNLLLWMVLVLYQKKKSCWFSRVLRGLIAIGISCQVKGFSASSREGLSKIYRDIARQSNELKQWPDSEKLCEECLTYSEEEQCYQLPHFDDGHGTIGVFTFLHSNKKARHIMDQCDKLFDQFCIDYFDSLPPDYKTPQNSLSKFILRSPPTSHHISVAILQEHPSFLRDPEDLERWRPISSSTIDSLIARFEEEHGVLSSEPTALQLDSLLWTPDGALIAGFVDISNQKNFQRLRDSSQTIARSLLGDLLTTRPKNLIHATIGRIVGLSPDATDMEHELLTRLARKYNTEIFPRIVSAMQSSSSGGGQIVVEELTLARNKIWMLCEYEEYSTWPLSKNLTIHQ